MAGRTGTTALQAAIGGGKVSDKAAQSALGEAVGRIASLTKRAQHSREAMFETGTVLLHTAETEGALFLASLAEGYLGEDKIKVGAVDLRAPLGLLAQGYGLYQTMTGQKGAGAHVMAAGTGLMASWLANVARNAGRTLAERRSAAAPAPNAMALPAPMPMPVVMQGLMPEPTLSGPMREVLLTPSTDGDELGRRGRGGRGRGRGRMKHRQKQREQPEDSEESLEGEEMGRERRRRRFVRADNDSDNLE